jgi:YegS/Rv2252/BmrU family lipid kinase
MAGQGWVVDVAVSQVPGDAVRIARDAAASCAAVFACGGDGTVSEVANGLLGTSSALGCIPGGTSNLWAAEHHVPADPSAALDLLVDGATRLSDIGWVDHAGGGRGFVLMAGLGFDAAVTEKVGRREKQLAGALAYVGPTIAKALTYRSPRALVRHDGGEEEIDLALIVASNTRLYARFPLAPEAMADDGLLDITLVDTPTPLPRGVTALPRLLRGKVGASGIVRRVRSAALFIDTTEDVHVQVDGDVIGAAPARIAVRSRALRVIVTAGANPMYGGEPGPSLQRLLEEPGHDGKPSGRL